MIAPFNRFELCMTMEQARTAYHPGQCFDDVKALMEEPKIARQFKKISDEDIRAELKETGGWEESELNDTDRNAIRILWIAAGNIVEEAGGINKSRRR